VPWSAHILTRVGGSGTGFDWDAVEIFGAEVVHGHKDMMTVHCWLRSDSFRLLAADFQERKAFLVKRCWVHFHFHSRDVEERNPAEK
jgi:hypothetical protein